MIVSINPADGRELARHALHDDAHVDRALGAAKTAQAAWRKVPVAGRCTLLTAMARVLRAGKARYAAMITREMGKPIAEAEAEIEKCAYNCDFYAENAAKFLADEPVASNASESLVVFDPLGVVLAIMPWNYPFWQFFRFAAPALAAGNGAILKHANNVPQCALAIEEVMKEAGCPEGLFATLLIEPSQAGTGDDGEALLKRHLRQCFRVIDKLDQLLTGGDLLAAACFEDLLLGAEVAVESTGAGS